MTPPLRKIALYCSSLARAGLERVVCDLALGMRARDLDVSVLSFLGGELEAELRAAGIDVHVVHPGDVEHFNPSRLASLRASLRMAWVLRRGGAEVLCVHGLGAHRVAAFAARLAGTPIQTLVLHSNYPDLRSNDPVRLRRIAGQLRPFDHFIAITPGIADLAVDSGVVQRDDITVVPNGIRLGTAVDAPSRAEIRAQLGFRDEDRLVILVARFRALKNHHVAVAAMREVVRGDPRIHLLLVGSGPEEQSVRALRDELGLAANVHLLGVRSDVPALLSAADLFLLPSDYEGLPVSLIEAMGAGLPAVVSDVPGIQDTLAAEPDCARLVAARDEPALAAAILAAFGDPDWLAQAGQKAARLARERYDAEVMVERYIALHEKLHTPE